jgi:nucleotide-binding universal stress UspA family protein
LLHEGGMARLYEARRARGTAACVVKVPRLGPDAPLSAFSAFENELRVLERLHGPHVPRLEAAGDLRTCPYLVMEYIPGEDLARAARAAPVAPHTLGALGTRLAHAVHELHRQNVIHLDLNPRNVRNRPDGTAVLIDFGLAHHALLPDRMDAAFGEAEGTVAYIAPEQVRHVRNESRSDVYAIGAILYRLATGAYPFGRPNLLSLKRRLFEPPLPPRRHNPDLPPWLQEIVLRCLEIRPSDRYPTARQVAYLLAHPEAVHLTRRAHRRGRAGAFTRLRLWWRSLYEVFEESEPLRPQERLAQAPHVLVALDLRGSSVPLREALRQAVRRLARNEPHACFTFLAVVGPAVAGGEAVARLAEMQNWARPLRLAEERAFFQVLPGDPGRLIVDYARRHSMDQIVLGARGRSALRRYLGSVSSRVVAQAPCTLTVVRTRRERPASSRRSGR